MEKYPCWRSGWGGIWAKGTKKAFIHKARDEIYEKGIALIHGAIYAHPFGQVYQFLFFSVQKRWFIRIFHTRDGQLAFLVCFHFNDGKLAFRVCFHSRPTGARVPKLSRVYIHGNQPTLQDSSWGFMYRSWVKGRRKPMTTLLDVNNVSDTWCTIYAHSEKWDVINNEFVIKQ